VPQLTVMMCCGSALLTLVLALTSVPRWRGSDVPFFLLALAPYMVIAALTTAGRQARRRTLSLFALALALSIAGVGCFAVDSWTFHAVATYRMEQRFTVIVVPLLQLAALIPFVMAALMRPGR
jgi:hypothetical protein